jgi:hypothetical protein
MSTTSPRIDQDNTSILHPLSCPLPIVSKLSNYNKYTPARISHTFSGQIAALPIEIASQVDEDSVHATRPRPLERQDHRAGCASCQRECEKCGLVASGIIIVIGSLIAAGCLYPQIGGYYSLAVGGGGLIVGLLLIAIGLYRSCKIPAQATSNLSQTPSIESEKIDEERSLARISHTFSEQIAALHSDINLPENLPKDIPPELDISGTKWFANYHLQDYMLYLATRFPNITIPFYFELPTIDLMMQNISEYVPSGMDNSHLNIPIYLYITNHWTLVYIDRTERTVEYYDSKKNYGNHSKIVKALTAIAEKLSKKEPNKLPYKFVRKINKVLQPDSYQCGPWVLYCLECRLLDPEFDFNQLDTKESQDIIKKYRTKVMLKLIEMNRVRRQALKEERIRYREYYKDNAQGDRMHKCDLKTTPEVERWKQILNGQSLIPGSQKA